MKLQKELLNGILIAVGIAVYFLAMEVLGLSDKFYLRFFNIVIVYYGVHTTLKSNIEAGKTGLQIQEVYKGWQKDYQNGQKK